MKRVIIIEDTLENKISYYHVAAFLIALPFDRFYSELVLISLLLHTLIHIDKQKMHAVFSFQTLVTSSVFFITLAGIIYSGDKVQGIKDLQRQSAILLFPLILAASHLDWRKYKIQLLQVFSFTCVFTILYLYADALSIIRYNKLPLSALFSGAFINHNFSEPVNLHATYLSIYALLSAAIFLYSFLKETGTTRQTVYVFSILVLLAGLLQLASRSVWISALIIAPCFPFLISKGMKKIRFVAVTGIFAVLTVVLITTNSSFKLRYVAQFKEDLMQTSVNNEILEPRMVRWQYVIKLIGQSPLYGYGSGSEKKILNDVYFNNKLYNSYLHELNAHNQYLSLLLKTGAWGLLIFLLTLIAGLLLAFRRRDILFLSFMIIICTVSFSENLLDVNKGIFLYAFFFPLFIHAGKPFVPLLRLKEDRNP
jgi:O-antigen ligase